MWIRTKQTYSMALKHCCEDILF